MFNTQNALRNPPMSPAQKLYICCFCSGLLLNGVANFTAPHHTQRPLWIAIDLIALALVIVGVLSGGAHMLRVRALKRQSVLHADLPQQQSPKPR